MARIRTIKPEFFTSPDTASVSHAARLLYIAMWSWADDHGRGEMNLLQLRAFAFPESDKWLDSELQSLSKEFQSLCKEVVNGFNLRVYTNNSRTFFEIPSWDSHQKTQRKANSKYPPSTHPDSVPDLRFHESGGISERTQGISESTQGNVSLGTGNREQGTGNSDKRLLVDSSNTTDSASEPGDGEDESTNETTSVAAENPKKSRTSYTRDFERFWETYPKKSGKGGAFKAWQKAKAEVDDVQVIIDGAQRYAVDPNRDPAFTKNAQGWLNDQRWLDEPLPMRGAGVGQNRAQHRPHGQKTGFREAVSSYLSSTPQNGTQDVFGQYSHHQPHQHAI